MIKELAFNEDAQDHIGNGVVKLARAVAITMGPKGRNVIIEREGDLPHITKDGVTVAKSIELENQYENIGAQLVKEVAIKTANEAGDGTTTATVLADVIFREGTSVLRELKMNPIIFKRKFDEVVKEISEYIKSQATPIKGDLFKIKDVATISANNDPMIGEIIASAVEAAGENGVILIEETTNSETVIEIVEGLQIDKGYESHYFMTDPVKQITEFENPLIFLYDKKINKIKDIYHILEKSVHENRALVIIADDYEPEVLSTLIANNMNGAIKVCALKIPVFGVNRVGIMEDIAILTGSTYIREEKGLFLKDVNINHLGGCNKFQASKHNALFIGGHGSQEGINNIIEFLQSTLNEDHLLHLKEAFSDRLARLSGGVVIIKVGATSDIELKEKRDRIDDALCATRAAISEGIVPGAGSTYIRAADLLVSRLKNELTPIEQAVYFVVIKALEAPFYQICGNAGIEDIDSLIVKHKDSPNTGFNLLTEEFCDLIANGIIDPAKVSIAS
ncbi:MAG: Hsp60 family chaperonin, partial [Turicibacter sp.]